jgi:NitT/TauT family transport system permease protein
MAVPNTSEHLPRGHSDTLPPTVFWRVREAIPRPLTIALSVISFATPLLLWVLVTSLELAPPLFLPSIPDVFQAMGQMWDEGTLLNDILISLFRTSTGFVLALAVSIPLGILMGTFPAVRALTEPMIGLARYMPAAAFIPLLILWLGLGEPPKIALIFIGIFFFNTLMVADAGKFVPYDWIASAYTLGAKRRDVLFTIMRPAMLPAIIDAARVNLAAAWNLVIIAELVAANSGLGFRILTAQRFLRTDDIFASLLVIGVIGLAMDLSLHWLRAWLCPWMTGRRD